MKEISKIGIALRGMAMGIAEVIPGVSGGTIAFISGIYKTLLDSISAVDFSLIGLVFKGDFKSAFAKINIGFLLPLMVGMGIGLVMAVFGVSYLLAYYPEPLWAFFFGLILASIPYMLKQMSQRNISLTFIFLVGTMAAYMLTSLSPVSASGNMLYIYFAGAIAICALVLPGISGSFILLLLGLYSLIIPTFKSFLQSPESGEFLLLAVFGLGCITGLAFISRLVSRAFEKYNNQTLALLSGFMLGSLNKIWPWRNIQSVLEKSSGNILPYEGDVASAFAQDPDAFKIMTEQNVFPSTSTYLGDDHFIMVIISVIAGCGVRYWLSSVQSRSIKV